MNIWWRELQSRKIGSWRLGMFLGVRTERAFYATYSGAGERSFVAEVTYAPGDGFLDSINHARNLVHPHLMSVYDHGRVNVDGTGLEYAVFDLPDDSVAEMLARGPLDAAHLRAISSGVASGLAYLHQRELCHGAVLPPNIYIVRNEARLSVDRIRRVKQGCKEADIRCLKSIFNPEKLRLENHPGSESRIRETNLP